MIIFVSMDEVAISFNPSKGQKTIDLKGKK